MSAAGKDGAIERMVIAGLLDSTRIITRRATAFELAEAEYIANRRRIAVRFNSSK